MSDPAPITAEVPNPRHPPDQPAETKAPALDAAIDPAPMPAPKRIFHHIAAIVLSLLIAAIAFHLYVQNNDFPPAYYHPDEPGKIEQILGQTRWNFHHPVLLLWTTRIAQTVLGIASEDRDVAILGRDVSAALAAVGVFAAAMAGYVGFGFASLLICGAAVALCPALLINAHYFKEDAALAGGMMLAVLGAMMVMRTHGRGGRIRWLSLLMLGIGCAAAASGKLVGVFTIVPAMFAIRLTAPTEPLAQRCERRTFRRSLIIAFCMINLPAIMLFPSALGGFGGEIGHALSGHSGLGLGVPNLYALRVALTETMPHLWIILGVGAVWLAIAHRRIGSLAIVLAMFPLTLTIVMALNRIPIPRYALPFTVLFYFSAALVFAAAIASLRGIAHRLAAPVLAIACIGTILYLQVPRCIEMDERFGDDSRQRLYEWVATQTPPGSRILMDSYVALHGGGDPWRHPNQPPLPQQITYRFYAAEEGSYDDVSRRYDYVAVANMNYDRFFDPQIHFASATRQQFAQYRIFYEDLFRRGKIVWSSTPAHPTDNYIDMDLRLYKVRSGDRLPLID